MIAAVKSDLFAAGTDADGSDERLIGVIYRSNVQSGFLATQFNALRIPNFHHVHEEIVRDVRIEGDCGGQPPKPYATPHRDACKRS